MRGNQHACPSPRLLERLLTDGLTGSERDSVEAHVENCASCQNQLEILVAPTRRARVPAEVSARPPDSEPAERFLSRLKGMSPPWAEAGSRSQESGVKSHEIHCRPLTPDSWSLTPVPDRVGQYEILAKLGKGGMGAVFKARHTELGKIVALKVLPVEEMDEVGIARFKNEIRAIGKLDHANIVVAHDAGETRGVHFLVMELVDGMDLARVVERHGRLSVPDACEAIRQAAIGLQHAYEQGLIHRDIKPSNLMLARDGRIRLLDLGLARSFSDAAADTLTAKGALLGTADYLAPEQWEHPHAADTRADIYSLGCTLYHLLAARPPFSGAEYTALLSKMRAHCELPPPPIEQICPEIPAGLSAALERMLSKHVGERFAKPAEVATALAPFTVGADLARLIAAENMTPDPMKLSDAVTPAPGAWETDAEHRGRGGRSTSRPRRRVLAIAVVSVCLLLATVVIAWPWLQTSPPPDGRPPAAKALAVTDLRVMHYRDGGKTMLGDLWTSSAAVRVNDSVRVAAKMSAPAYYYLIAFNPQGSEAGVEQLCQPEGENGSGAETARPDPRTEVQYPRSTHDFFVDAAGLQAFVLAASTKPLQPYKEWRSAAGRIPWDGPKDGGAWRWHYENGTFTRFPRERGQVKAREDVPEPLQKLRDFFSKRPEFEVVQIVAFPVRQAAD